MAVFFGTLWNDKILNEYFINIENKILKIYILIIQF